MEKETYNYGITDLDGKPVPDSKVTPTFRDMLESTGVYETDITKGVYAYSYDGDRIPLTSVDLNTHLIKFIAGLWRFRGKPNENYKVVKVHDKKLILGEKLDIQERDDFKFEYYTASAERYDLFGVLIPKFDLYVAKCYTKKGVMLRYGATREDARAFLRGAIMDVFAPNIANYILCEKKKRIK